MASACISSCVDDARVPVRSTYLNLNKWPESDYEFVRSISSQSRNAAGRPHPRVVDSISCRQMYLRSYTFSREEDYREEKTALNCLGRRTKSASRGGGDGRKSKSAGLKRAKSVPCSAFSYIFRRLLSCTTEIDVAN